LETCIRTINHTPTSPRHVKSHVLASCVPSTFLVRSTNVCVLYLITGPAVAFASPCLQKPRRIARQRQLRYSGKPSPAQPSPSLSAPAGNTQQKPSKSPAKAQHKPSTSPAQAQHKPSTSPAQAQHKPTQPNSNSARFSPRRPSPIAHRPSPSPSLRLPFFSPPHPIPVTESGSTLFVASLSRVFRILLGPVPSFDNLPIPFPTS
jgi:hypothetical protein